MVVECYGRLTGRAFERRRIDWLGALRYGFEHTSPIRLSLSVDRPHDFVLELIASKCTRAGMHVYGLQKSRDPDLVTVLEAREGIGTLVGSL